MILPETLPIVFIHNGYADYLQYALLQAQKFNPSAKIVLLGSADNDGVDGVEHHDLDDFRGGYEDFVDAYEHMSTNYKDFELMCFERWFILRNYMHTYKLEWVALLDSDVLMFDSIQAILPDDLAKRAAYCIPAQDDDSLRWSASPHVSVWSFDMLDKFCDFCLKSYQGDKVRLRQKWQHHQEENLPGGVCDMTLLYFFYQAYHSQIANLLRVKNGVVVNNTFSGPGNYLPNEFQTKGKFKKVIFKNQLPFVLNEKNEATRFSAIHFQGGEAKRRMPYFFQGSPLNMNLLRSRVTGSWQEAIANSKKVVKKLLLRS